MSDEPTLISSRQPVESLKSKVYVLVELEGAAHEVTTIIAAYREYYRARKKAKDLRSRDRHRTFIVWDTPFDESRVTESEPDVFKRMRE